MPSQKLQLFKSENSWIVSINKQLRVFQDKAKRMSRFALTISGFKGDFEKHLVVFK